MSGMSKIVIRVLIIGFVLGLAAHLRRPPVSGPVPLKWNDALKAEAVMFALESLKGGRTVRTSDGETWLRASFVTGEDRRFLFKNGLGIPDTVFTDFGLEPSPDGIMGFEKRETLFSFEFLTKDAYQMDFGYMSGPRSGSGYSIRAYREGDTHYFVFTFEWVS